MSKSKLILFCLAAAAGAVVYVFVPPPPGVEAATPATVSYKYDSVGRLISDTPSSGNSGAFSYDAAGNRTAATLN